MVVQPQPRVADGHLGDCFVPGLWHPEPRREVSDAAGKEMGTAKLRERQIGETADESDGQLSRVHVGVCHRPLQSQ